MIQNNICSISAGVCCNSSSAILWFRCSQQENRNEKQKSQVTNWNEPGCLFFVWQCWHGISVSILSLRFYKPIFFFPEGRTKLIISEFVKLEKNTLICGYPYKSFISMPVYFLILFHAIFLWKIVHRNTFLYLRIKYFSVTELRTAGIFSTVLILYRITPI